MAIGPGTPSRRSFCPRLKAGLEQVWIDRGEHVAQGVVAGDAAFIRIETAEEGQVLFAPERDLHEVVCPRDGGSERKQKDFR